MIPRKPRETHIALDIETNGTLFDCGIWEIGLAIQQIEDGCVVNVTPTSYEFKVKPLNQLGDDETMQWLEQQGRLHDYFDAIQHGDQTDVTLQTIKTLIDTEVATAQGNNPEEHESLFWSWRQFDYPRLEYTFKEVGITHPWKYWQTIDVSGLHRYAPEIQRPQSTHFGREDAKETLRCGVMTHNLLHARLSGS